MSLIVLFVLVGTPLLLTLIALSLARRRIVTGDEWKRVRLMLAAAVVTGGVVAWLLQGTLDLGRGAMLAPPSWASPSLLVSDSVKRWSDRGDRPVPGPLHWRRDR